MPSVDLGVLVSLAYPGDYDDKGLTCTTARCGGQPRAVYAPYGLFSSERV